MKSHEAQPNLYEYSQNDSPDSESIIIGGAIDINAFSSRANGVIRNLDNSRQTDHSAPEDTPHD